MKIDRNLLHRYQQKQCSQEERALIDSWIDSLADASPEIKDNVLLRRLSSLDERMEVSLRERPKKKLKKWAVAASILIPILLFGGYYANQYLAARRLDELAAIESPNWTKSVIKMENDQQINIDSIRIGDTVHVGSYSLVKHSNGEIQYINLPHGDAPIFNRLTTMSGGISSIVLADGSKVWLNAGSELRYPIKFDKSSREVELIGEAYFEIAKQEIAGIRVPFYVRNAHKTIAVLGTKFNANFYDEPEIALLEGKIALGTTIAQTESKGLSYPETLRPNELYSHGKIKSSSDIKRYVYWKNGYFNLNEVKLASLVKRMEEWYNIPIVMDEALGNEVLIGRMSRSKKIKEILDLITIALPASYDYKNGIIYLKFEKQK